VPLTVDLPQEQGVIEVTEAACICGRCRGDDITILGEGFNHLKLVSQSLLLILNEPEAVNNFNEIL
jgi:hypothetical protein